LTLRYYDPPGNLPRASLALSRMHGRWAALPLLRNPAMRDS
jgi:hypothetical protein